MAGENIAIFHSVRRYLRGERIGTGGTATVYKATDVRLNRPVALKVLHRHFTANPESARRLDSEVEITASLSHRGIVAIYDYGTEGDDTWVAMELMTGGDLRRRILVAERLRPSEVRSIAVQVLEALVSAHAAGVIHRDIKPRNILFDDAGRAKLADFGLAQSAVGDVLSRDGEYASVAGTAEYCAPEAITAGLWDARTDLYALGCTLYEALSGRPPYVANTPDQVLRAHVEAEPSPLPTEVRDNDPGLARMVANLIEKDPNLRFQSAEEALSFLQEGGEVAPGGPDGEKIACGWCGAPVSLVYPWCFNCGRASIPAQRVRRRGYTVVVAGPGKHGEQIKPDLRDVCCRATDGVGLDSSKLRKRLPRVPFVLVRGVNRAGAKRIVEQLAAGGVEAGIVGPQEANRSALARSITKKTMTMAPRVYLVMMGMGGGFFSLINSTPGIVALSLLGSLVAAVPAVLGLAYSRALVHWDRDPETDLLPEVSEVLLTVHDPLLHARMRSVTADAARLRRAGSAHGGDTTATRELERAIDRTVAGVASLVRSLSVLKESARAAALAGMESADPAERSEASSLLRGAEGMYTKTMERIGRVSLGLRRLALRLLAVDADSTGLELASFAREVESLGDEIEAAAELEEFLEQMA